MTERNSPGEEGYEVMVETTFDGCTDPKGEGGEEASRSTDEDSWSSSRSSCSNTDESVQAQNADTGFQSGSSASNNAEDVLPPEYCYSETYTHSPDDDPGRKRRKLKATVGIQTPPSSPVLHPVNDLDKINLSIQMPRTDEVTSYMDNLDTLFPHMTRDEINSLIPTCERYRDQAYSISHDSNEMKNETDDQQHASDAEYR